MLPSSAFLRGESTLNTDAAGSAPPDAFGPFRVLHQIGSGALGPVFRAYQPELDRLVAVKLFRLDLPPERVHQLVSALDALVDRELSHRGIAAPVGAGLTGVSAYLAQDFVAAESLDVVVRSGGASSPSDMARVAEQLATALDHAAALGVLHGSLHPRDVLLSSDDARVTGLGVAAALESVGLAIPVRRPYSAPERAVKGPWDRRADIFSLAALMFELLYGQRVSGAGTRAVAGLPEIDGTDRAALKRAFSRALAADPADRYGTAVEFFDALQSALTNAAPMGIRADRSLGPGHVEPLELTLTRDESEPEPTECLLPLEAPDFDVLTAAAETPAPTSLAGPSSDFRLRTADAALDIFPGVSSNSELPVLAAPPSPPGLAGSIESARSAIWPLVLALGVGVALGFGIAVAFIGREQPLQTAQESPVPSTAPVAVGEPSLVPLTGATPAPEQRAVPDGRRPGAGLPEAASSLSGPTSGLSSGSPAPSPPAARPVGKDVAGRLVVRSSPGGAQVFLNGRSAGVTPLTLRDVPLGSHRIRVAREGYVTAERRVTLREAEQSAAVGVDLVRTRVVAPPAPSPPTASPRKPASPAAKPGFSLQVDSRPAGARVFVDGHLVGTTPLVLSTVEAGEHAVDLELEGHRRWSSSVKVVAGERTRVAASLER